MYIDSQTFWLNITTVWAGIAIFNYLTNRKIKELEERLRKDADKALRAAIEERNAQFQIVDDNFKIIGNRVDKLHKVAEYEANEIDKINGSITKLERHNKQKKAK